MEVRKGYKKTEIGVIPEDWEVKELDELGFFSKGQGIRKDQCGTGNVPCIRYGELYTKHHYCIHKYYSYISSEISQTSKKLKMGDILFAGSGETKEEIGKSVAFVGKEDTYVGGDIVILSPQVNKYYSIFLGYLLNLESIQKQKSSRGQGDAVVHISANQLKKVKIPIPPLPEQKTIAEVLSDTDNLIQSLEKLIAKKQLIKQGTMQKLLTPKDDWEIKSFDQVFFFLATASYSRAQLEGVGNISYIHYGDIHTKFDTFLNFKDIKLPYIACEQLKSYSLIKEGDIVMADASEDYDGIGKCVEVKNINEKAIAGLHTFLLREKHDHFVKGFKGYILSSRVVKLQLCKLATGLKVYGISKSNLKRIQIPIPPKFQQIETEKFLSDIDQEIQQLQQKRNKYKQIKQGLMQELLTGKTRLI